ncbi:MAG: hypothetical protein JNN04_10685 [Cyclobacteriaceae bacterium]|nr:hypothetical protein [Cyclobacteriaceae bacterium]
MKSLGFLLLLLCWETTNLLAQGIPSEKEQIATAVLAAPAELRDEAMVYGYNPKGELTVLRKGTNSLICLGDDPKQAGINVSAYHADLEPFMARGRVLKAEGKSFQEIFDIREAEAKSGKLKMPASPSTLYVFTADGLDAAGAPINGYLRYVIYIPYATSESTGLPLKPTFPGQPWIMDPGTHRAHIMISPPMPEKKK